MGPGIGGGEMELTSAKWPEEVFEKEREKVFQTWPTGQEVDFDEVVAYLKQLPPNRRCLDAYERARQQGKTMITVRLGFGTVEEVGSALRHLEEGHADSVSIHIDSYSRRHQFAKIEQLIEEERRTGRKLLNGYPVANHGHLTTRAMLENIGIPTRGVSGGTDCRFIEEMMVVSGCTGASGSIIPPVFTLNTKAGISIEEALWLGIYEQRMIGWYEDHGVPLVTSVRGSNSGTAKSPSLTMALVLVEMLSSAAQGCRNFQVTYYQHGSLVQDVAYLRLIVPICQSYLSKLGYTDCNVFATASHYEGLMPRDPFDAFGVCCYQAITARFGQATELHCKSIEEGLQLPTIEAQIKTITAIRRTLDLVERFEFPNEPLAEEIEMIQMEVKCLMDNILELGQGDVLIGFIKALKNGTIEFPFSSSPHNPGKVVIARDRQGAARFLDIGSLPFNEAIIGYHKRKLDERIQAEGITDPFDMVLECITHIGTSKILEN